jgi:hypothetical protein
MDLEILCRASISAHGKALPCATIKSVGQSAFTVQLSTVCSLPCVFKKNARQSLAVRFIAFAARKTHNKALPCALLPLPCAADARQSL